MKIDRKTIALAAALTFATPYLLAQTTTPVPSQFATAHTVFLASAGITATPDAEDYVSAMYPSTYRMLSTLNYQMVTTPSAADLGMEVSVVTVPPLGIGAPSAAYMQLVVRDMKTHALIWTLQVPINNDFREKSLQKGLDPAEARMAADLKSLIAGNLPTSAPIQKTRMSQEKQ
jgi:hypothetical protein